MATRRWSAQIVALVDPEIRGRIDALREKRETSMAAVLREVLAAGLPVVEKRVTRRG